MFSAFTNALKISELRTRILFTLGLLFACRLVSSVPTPGVDTAALERLVQETQRQVGGGMIGLIDLFSGGALRNCAIGFLGIMPYISASIILQLMTAVIPTLERLAREGESGRQKLTQYTRYLTLAICVVQGFGWAVTLEKPGGILGISQPIVVSPGWSFRIMTVITMTAATMLLMWLGEQMTDRGIGNGISLIITVNIISRLPDAIYVAATMFTGHGEAEAHFSVFHLIGLLLMIFLVVAGTVAVTQAQRKVPIHTTKRVVGRKIYGGPNTYMPLRINYSGVMPIIFAQAILMFPAAILRRIPLEACKTVAAAFEMGQPTYLVAYALMILFFSYFWVATQFNPIQIADNLKRQGGYVPGIRPGRPTADFLDKTMTRITLAGAVFLTLIAVTPSLMWNTFQIPWLVSSFFGGTSLLIIVGVMLDTMRVVESYLLTRHYDGFLRSGRLRGRR